VLSGTIGGDEQVMSTNQYAAFYRINPATAAKAFQQLVDEGVLYKKRGIGMFAAPGARDALPDVIGRIQQLGDGGAGSR
jgi:GntR family transcriptional regulator